MFFGTISLQGPGVLMNFYLNMAVFRAYDSITITVGKIDDINNKRQGFSQSTVLNLLYCYKKSKKTHTSSQKADRLRKRMSKDALKTP
jgi:hypothetical protein